MENIYAGSAPEDAPEHRGWFVGHFMPEGDVRNSNDIEIKWGQHTKGEARHEWASDETRSTVSILVYGKFTIIFPEGETTLESQGDYVMWKPGVDHTWRADEDAVTITVRWTPSS